MPARSAVRDRFVTVGGLCLRYRDWGGDGRPFLALHGSAAHAHWWDPVAPRLARRLRVLALDWRGHGRSGWPRPPAYASADFAADLVEVIEHLRLERVVVAGHSRARRTASRAWAALRHQSSHTPVNLRGPMEGCAEWLERRIDAGVRHLVLRLAGPDRLAQLRDASGPVSDARRLVPAPGRSGSGPDCIPGGGRPRVSRVTRWWSRRALPAALPRAS